MRIAAVPSRVVTNDAVNLTIAGRLFTPSLTLTVGGVACSILTYVSSSDGLTRVRCSLPPTPGGSLLIQAHDTVLGDSSGNVFLQAGFGTYNR